MIAVPPFSKTGDETVYIPEILGKLHCEGPVRMVQYHS